MVEFIILSILLLAVLGFAGFIYFDSQKKQQILLQQMQSANEMLMAGSYQEWNRIKAGKKSPPNKIKVEPNNMELTEENRIPWENIVNVRVDDGPARKIKLYK